MDQLPLALAKMIQWNMPETLGEDRCIFMFGGLYIEIAAFKTFRGFLNGSRWVNALVNVNTESSGTVESFLNVSHEIKAAALYVLQQSAYKTIWKLCHQHQRQA